MTTTRPNPFAPTATNRGGDFEQCPAGNHVGCLLAMIDEGSHLDSYKGQPERKVRKVLLVFEVEAQGQDGKPKRFYVGSEFAMGYDDKGGLILGKKSNFRKLMEGWGGKSYADGETPDFTKALGRPAFVNVKHEAVGDRSYARLDAVSKPPAGVNVSFVPQRQPFSYLVDSNDPVPGADDDDKSEWLPRVFGERVHKIIARSLEKGGTGRKADNRPPTENGEHGAGAADFPYGASAPQQPSLQQQAEEVL
jgi:hypothetical protein